MALLLVILRFLLMPIALFRRREATLIDFLRYVLAYDGMVACAGSKCRLAITKLASANSVNNCAVFLSMPR